MRSLLVVGILVGAAGCLPAPPDHFTPAAGDMATAITAVTTPPDLSNSTDAGTTDGASTSSCGAQTFPVTVSTTPPSVFLLVDRSGSMSDSFGGGQPGTKWDAAQAALDALLTNNAGKAQWGLSMFPPDPSQDTCGKANIDVSLALGDETTIRAKIDALTNAQIGNPRGSTPTADALKTVRDMAGLTAMGQNNFVVLVTDGIPACNDPADVSPVIDDLYNRSPSVKTFVIGLGSETASNPTLLNEWAEKGHTAIAGSTTEYYQAANAAQVATAFDAIIGQAATCTYKLQTAPPDPSLIVGQLDGVSLANDPANGFTYDATTESIVFHGTACAQIEQGSVHNIEIVYGCPAPAIL